MKKMIAMLLAASLLMLSCSACDSSKASSETDESESVYVEDSNPVSAEDTVSEKTDSATDDQQSNIASTVDDMRDDNNENEIVFSDTTADEEQMKHDLLNSSSFYYQPGIEITDLRVIKRQTNPDEKTDYVFVAVVAENGVVRCNLEYELDYTLYNEGWIADLVTPYEVEAWEISPLVGPSIESALAQLSYNFDECNYMNEELYLENKSCTMYFDTVTYHAYATHKAEVAISFNFNENWAEWESASVYTVSETITWDLAGYWYPTTPDGYAAWRHYYLSISDDNPSDNSVYVVVLDDRNDNIYFDDYVSLSSDGCEFEFETYYTMNGDRFTDDRKMVITMDRVCYGALSVLEALDSYHDYARE